MTEQELKKLRDDILEEIDRMKHPETDMFNFGIASADGAVRRVVTKWLEKIKQENDSKVFQSPFVIHGIFINEMNITYIYLLENCYNDPNKVYIGKTKNIIIRERHHKRNYGSQIVFSIIDQVESFNRAEWEPLESFWLEQFRQWGFFIVNKNKKGGGGPEYWTDESKLKIKNNILRGEKISKANKGLSKSHKGKSFTAEHKAKIKAKRGHLLGRKNTWYVSPVLQFDLQGNFIREWSSQKEAQLFFNKPNSDGVGATCRREQKTAYGYVWKFKN